jgi:hypothetical protein
MGVRFLKDGPAILAFKPFLEILSFHGATFGTAFGQAFFILLLAYLCLTGAGANVDNLVHKEYFIIVDGIMNELKEHDNSLNDHERRLDRVEDKVFA